MPSDVAAPPLPALDSSMTPWRTETVHQCTLALAWTLGLTGLFAVWYAAEKWGLGLGKHDRLVRSPALVPMTIIGVPHIVIGYLFLLTSRRAQSSRARIHIAALTVLAIGLCWAFAAAGATRAANKIPAAAVALYFVVHQLRDEAFFYTVHRDAPRALAPERTQRFLAASTWILVVALAGLGIFLYDVYAHGKQPPRDGPLDYVLSKEVGHLTRGLLVAFVVATLVGARVFAWSRAESESLVAALRRHAPMAIVYGLFLAVVFAGSLSGTVLEAIVLWHVIEWFVFATRQATRREALTASAGGSGGAHASPPAPPPTAPSWLAWLKGTRRGFLTLHVGLSAIVFALMCVWAYAQHRSGPLSPIVSPEAFYYWTIFHVTVSFFPR